MSPFSSFALPLVEENPFSASLRALLAAVVLVGIHRLGGPARRAGNAFLAVFRAIVLVGGALMAWVVAVNVESPSDTDFPAFWVPARVAVRGLDFYDPASYRGIDIPMSFEPDFRAEILDAGFWYPPPTMLLAYPIGLLPLHRAVLLWYAIQLAAFAAAAWLLWKTLLSETGAPGLLGCVALLMLLRPTLSTLEFAQTNFLELLVLAAFWRDRDRSRGGVWLALAIVIKPFAAALLAFLAIRRRWPGLATALATLAALMLIAMAAFGPATTASFFRSNPISRIPSYVYSQDVNQSLFGTLLRLHDLDQNPFTARARGEMLVAAVLMLGITAWSVHRRTNERLLFALVLVTGLMLYPFSLEHYCVVLMAPILVLWAHPDAVPGGRRTIGIATVILYLLVGLGFGTIFWVYAASWLAIVVLGVRGARARLAEV